MRAYRNFRKYDSSQPFWQWISAIANNHCIDLLRQRTRGDQVFGDEEIEIADLPASDTSVVDRAISFEDAEALNDAMASLDDRYRVPLVLAYYGQASYEEIAEQLDVSRTHVGVLLLRGKQRLRDALEAASQEGEGESRKGEGE